MFDSENILQIKMDKLAKKVTHFNNYYVYRTEIGIRVKPISEFNDIKVNTAEYADVINDRFDTFIDLNIDSLLVLVNGKKKLILRIPGSRNIRLYFNYDFYRESYYPSIIA
jgi:hypothetical protein